ncbi:hypothetical protein [Streptomyces shenzhenensis]|uniref:hypothetical protein n=1 Tax=Streptomyces shenzhenensis TaxID=943815 RepID=UPI001F1ED3C9|nr:hypothetical protein [Streptomyces shenzhenensis]
MTWTIDESRVRPFLSAAERRDVTGRLWAAPQQGLVFPGAEMTAGERRRRKRGKDVKESKEGKDSKDGKESKEGKDSKDGKDEKEGKDSKDYKDGKDGKDHKDHKDGKDGKDHKDGKDDKDGKDHKDGKDDKEGSDWAMAPSGPDGFVRQRFEPAALPSAGMPQAPADRAHPLTEEEETAAELRSSRVNRLLRGRGVVI